MMTWMCTMGPQFLSVVLNRHDDNTIHGAGPLRHGPFLFKNKYSPAPLHNLRGSSLMCACLFPVRMFVFTICLLIFFLMLVELKVYVGYSLLDPRRERSYRLTHFCQSVCLFVWCFFSELDHRMFLIFFLKLGLHKCRKVTEIDFSKKISILVKWA